MSIMFMWSFYRAINPDIVVLSTAEYYVMHGDTLWNIAKAQIDEETDIRAYIDLIYKYNKGITSSIKAGQKITIPIIRTD